MSTLKQQMHNCEAAAAVSVGMTQGRGRGLFASEAMKAGSTVLIERPLVAMQSLGNSQDVTVCRNCLGFVGDLISQLEVLSGIPRNECVARHQERNKTGKDVQMTQIAEQNGLQVTGLFECRGGCGEVYCSSKCRSDHWNRCHRLLCVGPISEEEAADHPLVAFRIHAMRTNEIFLLVGEVMAQIATAFFSDEKRENTDPDASKKILAAAQAPFTDFVQKPWWDVALPQSSSEDEEDEETTTSSTFAAGCNDLGDTDDPASFAETLKALCEESSAMLRSAFAVALAGGEGKPLPAVLEQALSAEMFGRVVGMFEQNNVGVRARSPIPDVLRELLSMASEENGDAGCSVDDESVAKNSDSRVRAFRELLQEVAQLVQRMVEGEECDEEEGGWNSCCGGPTTATDKGGADEQKRHGKDIEHVASDVAKSFESEEETTIDDPAAVVRRAVDIGDLDDSSSEGDENGLFAQLDGTALFSLICCMNHSCRPNCVVQYPGRRQGRNRGPICVSVGDGSTAAGVGVVADPLVAEVLLLRDVSVGEELTQSYVTREMGLVQRRKVLKDYGFLCSCPRCVEEEATGASLS